MSLQDWEKHTLLLTLNLFPKCKQQPQQVTKFLSPALSLVFFIMFWKGDYSFTSFPKARSLSFCVQAHTCVCACVCVPVTSCLAFLRQKLREGKSRCASIKHCLAWIREVKNVSVNLSLWIFKASICTSLIYKDWWQRNHPTGRIRYKNVPVPKHTSIILALPQHNASENISVEHGKVVEEP